MHEIQVFRRHRDKVSTRLKKTGRSKQDPGFFEDAESSALRLVMRAVMGLILVFLAAITYLGWGLLAPVRLTAPQELREVNAVLSDYHGTIWGMEKERRKLQVRLKSLGIQPEEPITIFPNAPAHLRLIAVDCRLGYLVSSAIGESKVILTRIQPGRRLQVWVGGDGQTTGRIAYRKALQYLKANKLKPSDGERYELKVRNKDRVETEHWIPITPE